MTKAKAIKTIDDLKPDPRNANKGTERGLFEPGPAPAVFNIADGLLNNGKLASYFVLTMTDGHKASYFQDICRGELRLPVSFSANENMRRGRVCSVPHAIFMVVGVSVPSQICYAVIQLVTVVVASLRSVWALTSKRIKDKVMHIVCSSSTTNATNGNDMVSPGDGLQFEEARAMAVHSPLVATANKYGDHAAVIRDKVSIKLRSSYRIGCCKVCNFLWNIHVYLWSVLYDRVGICQW